jgi:hypothetical protein
MASKQTEELNKLYLEGENGPAAPELCRRCA